MSATRPTRAAASPPGGAAAGGRSPERTAAVGLARRLLREADERVRSAVGGRERRRVVVLLALVLSLESADLATIGAVAANLERVMRISHAELGLLVSASSVVAAAATIPVGMLADRVERVRLLAGAIVLWGIAMIASGAAGSFSALLVARLFLGAVTAAAGPTLASLTGDFVAPAERARFYGFVLSGELIGSGFGFLVSGEIAAVLSWRWAFWALTPPAFALAWALRRMLPEPPRGGAGDRLRARDAIAERVVRERDIEPDRARVLDEDPVRMPARRAVRYVLMVPTNRILIVASALGYFFFAGQRTFTVVFIRGHYGLSQATATLMLGALGLGALVGVLVSGRIADRLLRRGCTTARIVVAAVSFVAAAALFVPPLFTTSVVVALLPALVASAAITAPNPPLDAARLDIIPARLWGRAESVRTVLRTLAVAVAPLLFGVVADGLGGGAQGVQRTFLIMLVPLAVSGLILLRAMRTYPRDVATAMASERRLSTARLGDR